MPTVGSYESVGFFEISDADPAGTARNLFDQIFDIAHLQTVTKEQFNSWKISNHRLITNAPSTLQVSIDPLFAGAPVYVWVRFGMVSSAETYWRPWEKRIVTSLEVERLPGGYDPAGGHTVWLETVDMLYTLNYGEKTTVRSGTISDIVLEIARNSGIDTANAVIEPTQSRGVYYQSFQSDFDFITKRMIPRAVNVTGRGGYKLAIIDDVLHFHTLGYSSTGLQSRPIDYYSFAGGLTTHLRQFNRIPLKMAEGAAGITAVIADPLVQQKTELGNPSSDTARVLVLTPPHQGFQVTPAVPASFTKNIVLHVYENGVQEVAAQAQNSFDAPYQTQFHIKFNHRNQPKFRLFDFLDILFERSNAWTGTYYVGSVIHDMNQGILWTTLSLYRGQQIADQLSGILVAGGEGDQNPTQLRNQGTPDGEFLRSRERTSTVISGGGNPIEIFVA